MGKGAKHKAKPKAKVPARDKANSTVVAIAKQLNADTKGLFFDVDVPRRRHAATILLATDRLSQAQTGAPITPSRRHAAHGTKIHVPLPAQPSDLDVLYAPRNLTWRVLDKCDPDIAFYAV